MNTVLRRQANITHHAESRAQHRAHIDANQLLQLVLKNKALRIPRKDGKEGYIVYHKYRIVCLVFDTKHNTLVTVTPVGADDWDLALKAAREFNTKQTKALHQRLDNHKQHFLPRNLTLWQRVRWLFVGT